MLQLSPQDVTVLIQRAARAQQAYEQALTLLDRQTRALEAKTAEALRIASSIAAAPTPTVLQAQPAADELLNPVQAGKLLGVGPQELLRLRRLHKVLGENVGKGVHRARWVFRRSDVEALKVTRNQRKQDRKKPVRPVVLQAIPATVKDPLLTRAQAAAFLGLTKGTVTVYATTGVLPGVNVNAGVGRPLWHFKRSTLELYRAIPNGRKGTGRTHAYGGATAGKV